MNAIGGRPEDRFRRRNAEPSRETRSLRACRRRFDAHRAGEARRGLCLSRGNFAGQLPRPQAASRAAASAFSAWVCPGVMDAGPVFLTVRRAAAHRVMAEADLDPASGRARLSYEVAEQLFKRYSGGKTLHQLRHSRLTHLERRGVAPDATFRARREAGAVRGDCMGTAGQRSRRQGEPAGQDSRDRTVLRQMPGCCVHSGCIRRKHDAEKATKKRSDEGRCHYRPVVTLTHSAGLVNRSLPVARRTSAPPC